MKILICLSNVPDTTTKIKFVENNTKFDPTGVQWIINPWDELALTRAIELKESPDSTIDNITVLNVGLKENEATLRKALAMGADDAIRIDAEPLDAYYTASQLAEVIKGGDYDIILCGIESSDYNGSMVGGMISELLNYPSVSAVSKLEIENNEIKLNREIDGGSEIVTTKTPFIGIVQKGITVEPRIPSMRGIMMARKKPLTVVDAINVDPQTDYVSYEPPKAKAACKMIDAENVKELVQLLQNEAKAL